MTEKTHPACEELFELLIGGLQGSRGREVSAHVEGCEDCFGYLNDFEKITTAYEKIPLSAPSPETLKAVSGLARSVKPVKSIPWIRSFVFSKAFSMAMISFVVAGIAVYFKDHYYQEEKSYLPRVAGTQAEEEPAPEKTEKPSLPVDEGKESDEIVMIADQDKLQTAPVAIQEKEKKIVAVKETQSVVPEEQTRKPVPIQTASKSFNVAESPSSGFEKNSGQFFTKQSQPGSVSYKTAGLTTSSSEEENPDVLMTKAMTHEQKGEYAQAEEVYRTIEEKHPQFAKRDMVMKRRAKILEKLGRPQEARELRRRLRNNPPRGPKPEGEGPVSGHRFKKKGFEKGDFQKKDFPRPEKREYRPDRFPPREKQGVPDFKAPRSPAGGSPRGGAPHRR